jgi:hypothetical protein
MFILSAAASRAQDELVSVTDCRTHYDVVLDLSKGASHREIGELYGKKILEVCPQFEQLIDSYFAEFVPSPLIYWAAMRRVRQIKPQVPKAYRDEIEGIASALSGGEKSKFKDGKLSTDELYLLNLLGDVARLHMCSAVAVYGSSSSTGHTIIGHNFDWPDGTRGQIAKLQAVVTIKDGEKSTVHVSCLGFMGAVTAFNSSGLFAALHDSPVGTRFSARHKRSYVMDLRQALEQCRTLEEVSAFMTDQEKKYSFNHVIALADRNKSAILENNLSGHAKSIDRKLRLSDSQLRSNLNWDLSDAICTVNCFALDGNEDNHIDPLDRKQEIVQARDVNTPRWESIRQELKRLGTPVSVDGIESILSFYHPETGGRIDKGDIYNSFTLESVVFQPLTLSLDVAFRPRDGKLPAKPSFEHVRIDLSPEEPLKQAAN